MLRGFPNVLALALLLTTTALAGCTIAPNANGDTSDPTGASTATVRMKDLKYDPTTLTIPVGTTVRFVNDDPFGHTVTPTDTTLWGTAGSGDAVTDWLDKGDSWSHTFDEAGTYDYYCLPHASQAADGQWRGMIGTIIVNADAPTTSDRASGNAAPPAALGPDVAEIGADASAVPPPINRDSPADVTFELTSREVVAEMADGITYTYWTFDEQVPGPMLRARVGDTITIVHHNDASSTMSHNIDFHAVTGPGGGAEALTAAPGETAILTFKALNPGVYVYHCADAAPPVHIAHGMYGLIVIEPERGLPAVDKEFYVMQGDFYSAHGADQAGHHEYDSASALAEDPTFVVFNGRMGSLTGDRALNAEVGDTIRIFFGVGGPNLVSSFHIIGEIFDTVYSEGSLTSPPRRDIQTTLVPAGGAVGLELALQVPGDYLLVDHSLFRVLKGNAGILHVTGDDDPATFDPGA